MPYVAHVSDVPVEKRTALHTLLGEMAKSSPSCVRYLQQHRADRVALMYNMADLAHALAKS